MESINVAELINPAQEAFNSDTGYAYSVHYRDRHRFKVAKNESKNEPESIENIISFVNEFLEQIDFNTIENPIMK